MKQLALALAATAALALGVPATPAAAAFESYEAKAAASDAVTHSASPGAYAAGRSRAGRASG